jgi:sulfite exporter TauE/SafE
LETIDLISVVTIAFLGSFGHCIGMCGGIVIAYSSSKVDTGWNRGRQAVAHLIYNLGRTLTYTVLGFLFGYLGGVTTFSNVANGSLLVVAGVAMILAGLSLDGRVKFLSRFSSPLAESRLFGSAFRALLEDRSLYSLFMLGMLNGFLPCGFVYFFAITAASTASPLWGGFVMMVFGLSTIPAMFSLGFFVGLFQKTSLRGIMVKLAAVSVILYGLYTIRSGYGFIVDPERFILHCHGG